MLELNVANLLVKSIDSGSCSPNIATVTATLEQYVLVARIKSTNPVTDHQSPMRDADILEGIMIGVNPVLDTLNAL